MAHSEAILEGNDRAGVICADLRDPDQITEESRRLGLIDFEQPVAVLFAGVVHFVPDSDDPAAVVSRLCVPLVPGSHLLVSHTTFEGQPPEVIQARQLAARTATPLYPRSHRRSPFRRHAAARARARVHSVVAAGAGRDGGASGADFSVRGGCGPQELKGMLAMSSAAAHDTHWLAALLDRWLGALVDARYLPMGPSEAKGLLREWATTLAEAMLTDTAHGASAREIGAAMVEDAHLTDPAALAVTLRVLGAHLPPGEPSINIQAAIATGYAQALRGVTPGSCQSAVMPVSWAIQGPVGVSGVVA